MSTKIPCVACGTLILPSTAEKTGGVCMPCSKGWGGVLEESRVQHKKEKTTPQKVQEILTGFIVEVRTKHQTSISYLYGTETKILQPNEIFVGYFWQMTDRQDDGTFKKAHITKTRFFDRENKLFSYGRDAVFSYDEVLISIRALRGPKSNNRFLPEKFLKYETWNPA